MEEYIILSKTALDSKIKELERYLDITNKEIEEHKSIETFDREWDWEDILDELQDNRNSQLGALVSLQRFQQELLNSPTVNIEEIWDAAKEKYLEDEDDIFKLYKYPTLNDFLKSIT